MPERRNSECRNHIARAAIMRKGGVHQRSRSSERFSERALLNDLFAEGLEEYQHMQANVIKSEQEAIDEDKDASSSKRFLSINPTSLYC